MLNALKGCALTVVVAVRVFPGWVLGRVSRYVRNILVWADEGCNVVLLFGDPGETISSRIGKSVQGGGWASHVPWPAWLLGHFTRSIEADEGSRNVF